MASAKPTQDHYGLALGHVVKLKSGTIHPILAVVTPPGVLDGPTRPAHFKVGRPTPDTAVSRLVHWGRRRWGRGITRSSTNRGCLGAR